jgi:transposase
MYQLLSKDTICMEILPHLSTAKRGYSTKSKLVEIVNAILYKLKTGVQWEYLPVSSLFPEVVLSYRSVFRHFRKWCKNGDWQESWTRILSKHKNIVDLSRGDIDGSHTPALRGGEEVAYQGRKSKKTTNALFLTDRNGLPLAMSTPVAGNHHDLYRIEDRLEELFGGLKKADIPVDGLFINAAGGFDAEIFRNTCFKHGVMPNVDFNSGNGDTHGDYLLDELLYKERYSIERTNAWMDSFRTILNRFDTTISSWKSFNYIAFTVILLKKVQKRKKFR